MLQALVKNKARRFLLSSSDAFPKKVPREDIITDCVFGGLRYFTPSERGVVLAWMMPSILEAADIKVKSVELWPREERCEPDAVLKCTSQGGEDVTLIVEAKWGKNVLRREQIDKQWDVFGITNSPGTRAIQVLLVEDRTQVEVSVLDKCDGVRIHLMTWSDIAVNIMLNKKYEDIGLGMKSWLDDVICLFLQAGIRPFRGFKEVPDIMCFNTPPKIFYRPARFEWPSSAEIVVDNPVFWQQAHQY